MKITFIANNKENRLAKVLPKIESQFHSAGFENFEIHQTQKARHAIELAKTICSNKTDILVAVGGDGTLNEILNGVLISGLNPEEFPILGLLPYGSANDFSRTAKISNSIEELLRLIELRSVKQIDIGKIVIDSTKKTKYFINIAGLGLGPEVVKSLELSKNRISPEIDYFWHIIKCFLRYKKKSLSCKSENWVWKGKLLQMAVANAKYFGNAICVAPEAEIDDGKIQISIFGNLSIWDYLKNLPKLKKGIKIEMSEVQYYSAKELLIESEDSCAIEADGEYVGLIPARISILHKTIRFLMQ